MPGDTPSSAILFRTPGGVALMTTPLFSARTLTGVSLLGCAGGGALACKCEAKRSKRIPLSERLRRVRIKCQDQSVRAKCAPLMSGSKFAQVGQTLILTRDIWTYGRTLCALFDLHHRRRASSRLMRPRSRSIKSGQTPSGPRAAATRASVA